MNRTPLPPVMGWSTWNQFRQNISEALVLEIAHALVDAGFTKAGYQYLNLDDCWQATRRDTQGRLQFDAGLFPSREGLIPTLNALGLKVGLYSSAGALTCEDMPGSYGHEAIDAETFARWGVELLKYDYCHIVDMATDPHHTDDSFPTHTPPLLYIGIAADGALETQYPAAQAKLSGAARLEADGLHGLSCGQGNAAFAIQAPSAGTYHLSIGYTKSLALHERYVEIGIGGKTYEAWFPRSSGWSDTGRVHVDIQLEAGENVLTLYNPMRGQREDSIRRYRRMGDALKAATASSSAKPIAFSICEHGRTQPWTWAGRFASSWRIGPDISARWGSIMACYERAVSLLPYQQPGAYNDPDMLEVGIGSLTLAENRAHFSLWCMLSAPLVLGCDVRRFTAADLSEETRALHGILTNGEVIALNQDALYLQAKRIQSGEAMDVLLKPLLGGGMALCLLNKSDTAQTLPTLPLSTLAQADERIAGKGLGPFRWRNPWTGETGEHAQALESIQIAPHDVALFRLTPEA